MEIDLSSPRSLGFHVTFIPLSGATHPLGRSGAGDPRGQTALSGARIGLGPYPKSLGQSAASYPHVNGPPTLISRPAARSPVASLRLWWVSPARPAAAFLLDPGRHLGERRSSACRARGCLVLSGAWLAAGTAPDSLSTEALAFLLPLQPLTSGTRLSRAQSCFCQGPGGRRAGSRGRSTDPYAGRRPELGPLTRSPAGHPTRRPTPRDVPMAPFFFFF